MSETNLHPQKEDAAKEEIETKIETPLYDSLRKPTAQRDIQRNRWLLTINHPKENGLDHEAIKGRFITEFPTLSYLAMVDEQGSTYHTHIFAHFKSRIRFSTLKKHFPTAHMDAAKGTTSECISYLKKDGKWLDDTKKQEQKIEGTFEEWGEVPPEKGKNGEMAELYKLVKEGYSNAEIIGINPDYIRDIDRIDKVRTTLLIDKYKNTRRLKLNVIYVCGPTGLGKSRAVLDRHGDSHVFRVTDYKHPFDNYNCQEVMAFEEFRSQLPISDMLDYCDIYPIELPARYTNKVMCAETIYLLSNRPLEKQYPDLQYQDPESWAAFLRRINEVQVYQDDGSIKVYLSGFDYMDRDKVPVEPSYTLTRTGVYDNERQIELSDEEFQKKKEEKNEQRNRNRDTGPRQ